MLGEVRVVNLRETHLRASLPISVVPAGKKIFCLFLKSVSDDMPSCIPQLLLNSNLRLQLAKFFLVLFHYCPRKAWSLCP